MTFYSSGASQRRLKKYTNRITRASTRVPLVKGERNVRDALTPTVSDHRPSGAICRVKSRRHAFGLVCLEMHAAGAYRVAASSVRVVFVAECCCGKVTSVHATTSEAITPLCNDSYYR